MTRPRSQRRIFDQNWAKGAEIGYSEEVKASGAHFTLGHTLCAWAAGVSLFVLTACGHPAERVLQGQWLGSSVENFDPANMAAATGWARGTSLEFSGRRIKVTLPAQTPKVGVYELAAIEEQNVTLHVLSSEGETSELELIVDDERTLRWVMGEGRTMLLHKQP